MSAMITAIALATISSLSGTQWPVGEIRVFSDTCIEGESGDIAGHIVTIVRRRDGWQIKYSWSEGALSAPVHASSIGFDLSSGRLSFVVNVAGRPGARGGIATFDGFLLDSVLIGKAKEYWEEQASPVTLNRTKSEHPDDPKIFCR